MAKASEPRVSISARVSADVAAEIEAMVTAEKRTKTEVVEELVRVGLAAKRGSSAKQDTAASLSHVAAMLESLVARPTLQSDAARELGTVVEELRRLPDAVAEEVAAQQEETVKLVAGHIDLLRRDLRTAAGTIIKLAFSKLSDDEARKVVQDTFGP